MPLARSVTIRVPDALLGGCEKKGLSLQRFVQVIETNPAKLSGIFPQKGTIALGSDAKRSRFTEL